MGARDEWYDRGYLPHYHNEECVQTITLRLADSIPVSAFKQAKAMARSPEDRAALLERYLDQGRGRCLLARRRAAEVVRDCIKYCDGKKYDLVSWVIMPNHAHIGYANGRKRPTKIAGEIKTFTSRRMSEIFDDVGSNVWQVGTFDRYVRDARHRFFVTNYFWFNPVRAGLVESPWDWEFSSIHDTPFERRELDRWFEKYRDSFWDCWK